MRPVVVELLERRVAGRLRDAQRDDEVVVGRLWPQQEANRSREFGEIAVAQPSFRLVGGAIDTPAKLQRGVRRPDFLVQERGKALLIDRRRQRLFAQRLEGA